MPSQYICPLSRSREFVLRRKKTQRAAPAGISAFRVPSRIHRTKVDESSPSATNRRIKSQTAPEHIHTNIFLESNARLQLRFHFLSLSLSLEIQAWWTRYFINSPSIARRSFLSERMKYIYIPLIKHDNVYYLSSFRDTYLKHVIYLLLQINMIIVMILYLWLYEYI